MVNTLENTSHVARETLGNVLVIGGCGFVGSHIVDILRSSYNAKISIVSRNCTTHHTKFSDVIYCDADISSIGSLLPVFEKLRPDVVIHTVAPPPTAASDEEFYRVSVEGTRCIIEACQKTGVKALVYTSSPSVCRGDIAHGSYANMDESKPVITGLAQKDVYSRTKAEADTLVLAANRQNGLFTCCIRSQCIFGERDQNMMPGLIDRYNSGKANTQIGENTNLFDFTYVGNCAQAHLLAAVLLLKTSSGETLKNGAVDGEAFFVSNDEPIPFWTFGRKVFHLLPGDKASGEVKVMGKQKALIIAFIMEWAFWLLRLGKPPLTRAIVHYCCLTSWLNNSKAKNRLGYKVQVSMEDAIEKSVKWFIEHGKAGGDGKVKKP